MSLRVLPATAERFDDVSAMLRPRREGAPACWCGRIDVSSAYVGTVSMFEKAGFGRVLKTESRSANLARWIMRLELRDQAAD